MITDFNLRLSGTTAEPPVAQSIAISSGTVSTNVVDISSDKFNLSDGEDIEVHFGVVTSATASSPGVNITLDIALYAVPVNDAAGSAGTIASVAYTNASVIFTKAAHGLGNGTRVTLGSAIGSSFTTSTAYYVVNATANTFSLAAAPNGAAIAADAASNVTITWYGEHLGTLIVPYERLVAGTEFTMCASPAHMLAPTNRYIIAVYTPSAALNGGSIFAHVVYDTSDGRKFYPNGFTIL